jgi:dihydropyrimidinase
VSTMLDLLMTNATVVNSTATQVCHIGVRDGRVAALYDGGTPVAELPSARRSIDATGRVVIPGGVDGHCHIEQVTGPYSSLDDFETATVAALWGAPRRSSTSGSPPTAASRRWRRRRTRCGWPRRRGATWPCTAP